MKYHVTNKKPWFWNLYKLFFPQLDWDLNILTWGDTIYCKRELRPDVRIHEVEHVKQQKGSKIYGALLIILYLLFPKYRYKLELEACRAQFGYCRRKLNRFLLKQLYDEQVDHLYYVIGQGKIPREQILRDFHFNG